MVDAWAVALGDGGVGGDSTRPTTQIGAARPRPASLAPTSTPVLSAGYCKVHGTLSFTTEYSLPSTPGHSLPFCSQVPASVDIRTASNPQPRRAQRQTDASPQQPVSQTRTLAGRSPPAAGTALAKKATRGIRIGEESSLAE